MPVISSEEVLKHMNLARTNPKNLAQIVSTELGKFIDDKTLPLVPGCNYSTNQGKKAWIQCIKFMEGFKPIEPLKLSASLSLVAEDHAADMSKNNFQGHTGSDGSSVKDRILRRCEPSTGNQTWGENIGGDFMYEGRDYALNSVKSLMIDDGVPTRGHRENILSTQFKYVGIGSRVVGDRIRVVMVFHSHDPKLKNDKPPAGDGSSLKPINAGTGGGGSGSNSGSKTVVSRKSHTETSTSGGKTTTKTTEVITYSDGSTETKISTQIKG